MKTYGAKSLLLEKSVLPLMRNACFHFPLDYLSIHLSIYLSIHLSIYPSIYRCSGSVHIYLSCRLRLVTILRRSDHTSYNTDAPRTPSTAPAPA